jgi:hypothetical protein
MNRAAALILLVVGIILVVYGINAANYAGSGLSRAFTGVPSDKSLMILAGGTVLAVLGVTGGIRRGRSRLE